MSGTFNYEQYADYTAKNPGNGNKVGFFKLKNDGDEALIRINCASVSDLTFASVHTISAGGKWLKVACHDPLGTTPGSCALCAAQTAGNSAISKASKKVYIQMLAAYKKPNGEFEAAAPVIWERAANFSREIAQLLKDYGALQNIVLKVTRNGVAGDMKTTYSMAYIPVFDKVELVPNDFSAFTNFNIARHSFYEKTDAEINTYFATGAFPEAPRNDTQTAGTAAPTAPQNTNNVYEGYVAQPTATPANTHTAQQPQSVPQTPVNPAPAVSQAPVNSPYTAPAAQAPVRQPAQAPASTPTTGAGTPPARTFGGFTF